MELLLLLASDAIEELEMIAKHERRGVHLALYYIVLASSDGASGDHGRRRRECSWHDGCRLGRRSEPFAAASG
jgi:hypothetical protein